METTPTYLGTIIEDEKRHELQGDPWRFVDEPTQDELRMKWIETFDGIFDGQVQPDDETDYAAVIEGEIFKYARHYCLDNHPIKCYRIKAISLKFNLLLKENRFLARLLDGSMKLENICHYTAHDLFPALRNEYYVRQANELKRLEEIRNQKTDGMFPCHKCKSKNTTYEQKQTRSADEGMTTFHECRDCGNRWKS